MTTSRTPAQVIPLVRRRSSLAADLDQACAEGSLDAVDLASRRHPRARASHVTHPVDHARDHLVRALTAMVTVTQAREGGHEEDPADLYEALAAVNVAQVALANYLEVPRG